MHSSSAACLACSERGRSAGEEDDDEGDEVVDVSLH